ncbi:hypothetical protein [Streptomyces prunicolor]
MTSPIAVLRRAVAWPIKRERPTKGKHRLRPAVLLPDEPIYPSTEPVPHADLDGAHLEQLLDSGEVAANAYATCPNEQRRTFHAFESTGTKRCWDCGTASAGDALGAVVREAS